MTTTASYLIQDEGADAARDQVDWVPEFSRRARGFSVYAALRSLGRSGVAEVPGAEVLNDVVLNQVLFRFESDERTATILRHVQEDGAVWMSGTTWKAHGAIRLSVSNWETGEDDIGVAVDAFRKAAQATRTPAPAR